MPDTPPHPAPTSPTDTPLPRWLPTALKLLALAASLGVFGLYMQTEFLLSLADRLWSCF